MISETQLFLDPRSLYKRKDKTRNNHKNTAPMIGSAYSIIKETSVRRSLNMTMNTSPTLMPIIKKKDHYPTMVSSSLFQQQKTLFKKPIENEKRLINNSVDLPGFDNLLQISQL